MAKKPNEPEKLDPIVDGTGKDQSNSVGSLLTSIEIIESLKAEQRDLAERIKEEKAGIKSMGFDTKIVNKVLARRARKADEVAEEDSMISAYEQSLEEAVEQRRAADRKPAKAKTTKAPADTGAKPTADLQTPPEDPPAGAVMENGKVILPAPGF